MTSIILNYVLARLIGGAVSKTETKTLAKVYTALSIVLNLGLLIFFKYFIFLAQNIDIVLNYFHIHTISHFPTIILPIGISFFTFHALSYGIDVYRKDVTPEKSFINTILYISFFPQLIAGPIIRYKDIAQQIILRESTTTGIAEGIRRFIVGLAKKALVADTMGIVADKIFALPVQSLSPEIAWCGIIAYTLQIYFDFSGYSDMAIGLARIFGFTFLENFDHPYQARSIKDFWHRWNISLSRWFRDYLYIPLGGNRKGVARTYVNLLIVFFIVGLWHGASWTFVVWGLWHGFFLILERTHFGKILQKSWVPLQHVYSLLVIMIGWVLFRSDTFSNALMFFKQMSFFGAKIANHAYPLSLYLNPWIITIALTGIIFSTDFIPKKLISLRSYSTISLVTYTLLLIISAMALADGTYHPFIYFKF
jgi:alginate O-acetyltransferase complex protein AlgI